ncbi:MAG: WD40 repeat domain-containing protein, partial [Anaerolineae bacterium]|nr:WD40 repeat domain-containing protein [Anaerolineae bacterium]
ALPVAIAARHVFDPPEAEVLRILGRSAFSPGPRYRFPDSPRSILGVDISADGAMSAYAGTDGVIYLVDTSSGEALGSIETGSPVSAVAFSPDGARIAAALADTTVGVWNIDGGEKIHRLSGHEMVVSDVEFSADGATLASSSADTTVRLWDAASGEALHTLRAHIDYVIKLSFSPDGARLASASSAIGIATSDRTSENNTVQIWDVATGENILTIPPEGPGYYRDVEFSPDGQTVAASTWSSALGGNVRIFDAQTGEQVQRIYAHRENIPNIEFAPDGESLATAATDTSIKIWNIDLAVPIASYVDFGLAIQDIEYTPAGDYMMVALGSENHFPDGSDNPAGSAAILWDLQNRAQSLVYKGHTDWSWATDISPDGRLVASGSGPLRFPASIDDLDATVRVWDAETGEELHILEGHENTVDSVKFLADSQQLLSSSWDGTIRRWDLNEGVEIQQYVVPDERVYMVELLPNGAQFVSGSTDAIIRLWDLETGEVLREYSGHTDSVNGVHVSADGTRMVSASGDFGGDDYSVRLWDVESGELLMTYEGHSHIVNYAKLSPDMEYIISTSWDDSVRMWNTATGEEVQQFVGHAGNTFGIAITADSGTLLTTSSDTTVRMWDVASGEELNRFENHSDWIQEVVFSPDESFAVSAGQDNVLRRWRIQRTADDLIGWASDNRYIRELSCAERQSYRLECEP